MEYICKYLNLICSMVLEHDQKSSRTEDPSFALQGSWGGREFSDDGGTHKIPSVPDGTDGQFQKKVSSFKKIGTSSNKLYQIMGCPMIQFLNQAIYKSSMIGFPIFSPTNSPICRSFPRKNQETIANLHLHPRLQKRRAGTEETCRSRCAKNKWGSSRYIALYNWEYSL